MAGLIVTACGSSGLSRDEVEELWVSTFRSRYELTEGEARCVVQGFFADLDDDELRPLTKGAELSDAQAARIAEIAAGCASGTN